MSGDTSQDQATDLNNSGGGMPPNDGQNMPNGNGMDMGNGQQNNAPMNNNNQWNGGQPNNMNNMPPQQGYGPQGGYGPQPGPGYGPQQGGYPPQQPYPPQGYPQQPGYGPGPQPGGKSSTTAGLLGIFLGAFGVHDFYLGYKTMGIIHVCLGGGGILLPLVCAILTLVFAGSLSFTGVATMGLVTTILTPIGLIALSASATWGLVTGIMCLTKSGKYAHDANGVPLS